MFVRRETAGKQQRSCGGWCVCSASVAYEIRPEAFDAKQYFKEPKDAKRNDRYTHFAVAASKLALQDAGTGPLSACHLKHQAIPDTSLRVSILGVNGL